MLEGLYSAASGMEAQQNQFDAISNDMANLDTPGYQSTVVGFHDLLYSNGAYGSTVPTGAGSASAIVGRDQSQGAIETTNRSLDVAVQGQGYIEVRRPDGSIGLTRNGRLELNAKRQSDGWWWAEGTNKPYAAFDFGQKKGPSPWLTAARCSGFSGSRIGSATPPS